MPVAPIKPSDVVEKKAHVIPDAVIETFNELIGRNFSEGLSTIEQEEVVAALVAKGFERQEIFDKHYLNVEELYRRAGWGVEYEKPECGAAGSATFRFFQMGRRASR